VLSASRPERLIWTWNGSLSSDQAFQVRFWHDTDASPLGIAPYTRETEQEIHFGYADTYVRNGYSWYYLDVVVVQTEPHQVLSESARIRVRVDPNK
jgi:hypothetical protein